MTAPPDALDPLALVVMRELGPKPTPADRRAVAGRLRALADRQEAIAAADQAHGAAYRRRQLDAAPRSRTGGRPKGSGATFVRIEAPSGQQATWRIHIGRALWQQLGEFGKVAIVRVGGVLVLTPAARGDASFGVYSVTAPANGMPRLSLGQETAERLRLVAGRHQATITDGAIHVTG